MITKKSILLVLGMHRSGTSVIARAAFALGASLGNELMHPGFDNPKGFFEDVDIANFNDLLLEQLESDVFSLTSIHKTNPCSSIFVDFAEKAKFLLQKKIVDTNLFAIKDPRICRLLWFWLPVFEQLDIDVKIIIAVRHPLSVVKSLFVRNGLDMHKSLLLWQQHNIAILQATHDLVRVFIDYDELMINPRIQLIRLLTQLSIAWSENIENKINDFINDYLSCNLRHSQFDFDALQQSDLVTKDIIDLYSLLMTMCRDEFIGSKEEFISQCNILDQSMIDMQPTLRLLDKLTKRDQSIFYYPESVICDVFWKDNSLSNEDDFGLAKNYWSRVNYLLNSKAQDIRVVLDNKGIISSLRVNIVNFPAAVVINKIELRQPTGDLLWEWLGNADSFSSLASITVLLNFNNQKFVIICWNKTSSFEINLRPEILTSIRPESTLDLNIKPINLLDYLKDYGQKLLSDDLLPQIDYSVNLPDYSDINEVSKNMHFMIRRISHQLTMLTEFNFLLSESLQSRDDVISELHHQLAQQQLFEETLRCKIIKAEAQLECLKKMCL